MPNKVTIIWCSLSLYRHEQPFGCASFLIWGKTTKSKNNHTSPNWTTSQSWKTLKEFERDIVGPEFVRNILYKITLYTTVTTVKKSVQKLKRRKMVQSLSILRKKQQSSNASLVLTPFTLSFRKCKNMKITLENAAAKCTTNKQQTMNTHIQHRSDIQGG